jgi:hypothetical protein
VPEYVAPLDEDAVQSAAFELLFAFDEVISLGYKEHVTVQQARSPALTVCPVECAFPCAMCGTGLTLTSEGSSYLLLHACGGSSYLLLHACEAQKMTLQN